MVNKFCYWSVRDVFQDGIEGSADSGQEHVLIVLLVELCILQQLVLVA